MEQYIENQPPPFELITENVYLDDTGSSRDKKKAKKMVCECQFDPGMLFEQHNNCNISQIKTSSLHNFYVLEWQKCLIFCIV